MKTMQTSCRFYNPLVQRSLLTGYGTDCVTWREGTLTYTPIHGMMIKGMMLNMLPALSPQGIHISENLSWLSLTFPDSSSWDYWGRTTFLQKVLPLCRWQHPNQLYLSLDGNCSIMDHKVMFTDYTFIYVLMYICAYVCTALLLYISV